jgi:hypothetical protein
MTRHRLPLAVLLVALLLAGACSDDDEAGRGPTRPDEPTTTIVDYSGVALRGVAGETTTTIDDTGSASILGTVTGPAGLLPGATVRIERLVGSQVVRHDVVSGADGRFELRGVPGGRYRVRAFLAPALAVTAPDVRFLQDGQEHAFDLLLTDQRGVVARASVAPDPPYLLEDVNLAIVVASRSVDPDGIVRSVPVPGVRVELDGVGAWGLRSSDDGRGPPPRGSTTTQGVSPQSTTAFTDALGEVRFELTCLQPGPSGLSLLVAVTVTPPAVEGQPPPLPEQRLERLDLELPDCIDPASTTTTTESSTTTEDEG